MECWNKIASLQINHFVTSFNVYIKIELIVTVLLLNFNLQLFNLQRSGVAHKIFIYLK